MIWRLPCAAGCTVFERYEEASVQVGVLVVPHCLTVLGRCLLIGDHFAMAIVIQALSFVQLHSYIDASNLDALALRHCHHQQPGCCVCLHSCLQVYRILLRHSPVVQPLSVDEAYCDLTQLGFSISTAEVQQLVAQIRQEIHAATGCTASAGKQGNGCSDIGP